MGPTVTDFIAARLAAYEGTAYRSELGCACEWYGHPSGKHVCEKHARLAFVDGLRAVVLAHPNVNGKCGTCAVPPPLVEKPAPGALRDNAQAAAWPCPTLESVASMWLHHPAFNPHWTRIAAADVG